MTECCDGLKQHFPEHCLVKSSVAKEKGKKLILSGCEHYCRLRVDGCWIDSSNQKKCDFIMFCCDLKKAYLTEMKGAEIVEACDQIERTYYSLPAEIRDNYTLFGCIVASKFPKANTRFYRAQDRLRKLDIKLKQKSRQMEVNASSEKF